MIPKHNVAFGEEMQRDKYDATPFDAAQKREAQHNFGDELQYLLRTEEQILHAISARAPLPVILNAICSALDCQIGNIVSLISLPSDGPINVGEISGKAGLFGLHISFSAGILSENGEELGLLEMFCCIRRKPSLDEQQLIQRAMCLAGIAIKHYNENGKQSYFGPASDVSLRGFEMQWPVCVN
jgi:hypothetical protein